MLRVAWLISGDESEGIGQAIRGLARRVRDCGTQVAIISIGDGLFCRELQESGFNVRMLNARRLPGLRGGYVSKLCQLVGLYAASRSAKRGLVDTLRDIRADAVHVLWPTFLPLAGPVAAQLGILCVWEMPNVPGQYPLGVNRMILQRGMHRYGVLAIANSRFSAAAIGERPVRPVVLYPGADEGRFDPAVVEPVGRDEIGIPADAIVLGIFGRIVPLKGQLLVLQALADLKHLEPALHLLLVGPQRDAGYAAEIRAAAAAAGVSDRLHSAGSVSDPERYYGAVDIAVNSRVDAEPYGLSVVEAMMMGKPVLAHALGGPAETVLDGVTGWLTSEATPAALKVGLERALSDRPRWAVMGAAGSARAREGFSLGHQARRYQELLEQALGQRAQGRRRGEAADGKG